MSAMARSAPLRLGQLLEALTGVDRFPPRCQAQVAGDDAGRDVAPATGDGTTRMSRGSRHVQPLDRRSVAEVIPHRLITGERAHEDVALDHVDELAAVVVGGVDEPS